MAVAGRVEDAPGAGHSEVAELMNRGGGRARRPRDARAREERYSTLSPHMVDMKGWSALVMFVTVTVMS